MTAREFADTNILIYAQGSDPLKAQRAIEIVETMPVISTQVINEATSAPPESMVSHSLKPTKSPRASWIYVRSFLSLLRQFEKRFAW